MTNQEYANSLRQVADWFEAHPEIPVPPDNSSYSPISVQPDGKEGMAAFARAVGSCKKEMTDYCVILIGNVAGIPIRAVELRDAVCEKIVLGTETVTQKVPTQWEEQHVEREIVEWRCHPLLDTKVEEVTA